MRGGPPDMSAALGRGMYPLQKSQPAWEKKPVFSLFLSLARALYWLSPVLRGREAEVMQLSGAQSRVEEGRVTLHRHSGKALLTTHLRASPSRATSENTPWQL